MSYMIIQLRSLALYNAWYTALWSFHAVYIYGIIVKLVNSLLFFLFSLLRYRMYRNCK